MPTDWHRARLLRNAGLILLDEPTEGLDMASERSVIAMLQHVFRDKSMMFITHRVAALPDMDNIVVLETGQIVEEGTHTQLLELQGVYAKMWKSGIDMCDDDTSL